MKSESEMKYDEKKTPVGEGLEKPPVAEWRIFTPKIDLKTCGKNYRCVAFCPHNAISIRKDGFPEIDYDKCTGCLICLRECPTSAIFEEKNL